MVRHRVPDQALRNFLSILLGFILGGINNLVVLPWAFDGNLGEWGLIRVVSAWGTLLAPILAFGATSAINRYSGKLPHPEDVPRLHGTLIWPLLTLFLLGLVTPCWLFPEYVADLLGLEGHDRRAVKPMAILAGIQGAQAYFAGFLSSRLKTALATFLRETLFKLGYLALAITLGLGWLAPDHFLPAFVALYAVILALLIAQAIANHFRINLRGLRDTRQLKEIFGYGATLIISTGAVVILGQIDIIMVGRLLSLEAVPAFTIAMFIAAVTQIPHRSMQRLLTPLISRALNSDNLPEVWRIVDMSHRSLLLGSGWIMVCIWAAAPEIDLLMPAEFKNLNHVIFTIALCRVIQSSALGSQATFGQSDQYRWLIVLHWVMVIVAIPLNLLFIPDYGLGLGLLGAAMATLIAVSCSVVLRQWLIWRYWKIFVPGRKTLVIMAVLTAPALLLHGWNPGGHPLMVLVLKGVIATLWTGGLAVPLRLVPEAVAPLAKRWPRFSKWA